MSALLEQFLLEGRDLIGEATRDLIVLERTPDDGALVARVFRAFHTLKGSSGVFGIQPLTRMLHAAEDILTAIRVGRAEIDAPLTDALLECLDQTAQWLDNLEASGTLPDDAESSASRLIDRLRRSGGTSGGTVPEAPQPIENLDVFTEAERLGALEALRGQNAGTRLFRVVYEPDPRCFFNGDDPLKLIANLPGLTALRVSPREDWPALDSFDPFQCNLVIDALTLGEEAAVRHAFRLVSNQVRITQVQPEALTPAQTIPAPARRAADIVSAVLAEQRRLLSVTDTGPAEIAGHIGSAAAAASNALLHEARADLAETITAACRKALERHDPSPLIRALDNVIQARRSAPLPASSPHPSSSRVLRVEEERIDRLFALVGEMIVAKNTLGWLAGRTAEAAGSGDFLRPFQDLHAVVERLTRDMHDAVVQIRMVPVGQVFERFPRLVRDLSLRLGKPVDLAIEGASTSADKTVVEALFEPLLHLVRNSLDHGVEPPEERRRLAKPDHATVTLRAFHSNDRIVVEVADDGRGIDIAAVGRKAVLHGVLAEEQLAALSDDEIALLIFALGLSTIEEASDLSGRGVGMYAVRMAIERIGGSIGVHTLAGR